MDLNIVKFSYLSHIDISRIIPNLRNYINPDRYYRYFFNSSDIPFMTIAYIVRYNLLNRLLESSEEPYLSISYTIRHPSDKYIKSVGRNIAYGRLNKFLDGNSSHLSFSIPLKECANRFIVPGMYDPRYLAEYPETIGYRGLEVMAVSSAICHYINSL